MKKSVSALCLASLISVATAGVANAAPHYAFAPPGTYSFTGPVSFGIPGLTSCTQTVTVIVPNTAHSPVQPPPHGDVASIVAVTTSGSLLCSTMVAAGLPWTLTPVGASSVVAAGVRYNTTTTPCGPGSVPMTWTSPAKLSFTNVPLGPCRYTGTLTGTPSTISLILVP